MSAPDIHLSIRGASKSYGDVRAAADVSLDIAKEEFVSLLGSSGSGKTTLLMMVAGFTMPDGGRILLDGEDVTYAPPHRRQIGVVFQAYALFPHMTVFENIAYPLRIRRIRGRELGDRVERALDLVQLEGMADRYPQQLSGGQQQRVALARATIFEPKVLLLDEPLGALDKKLRGEMQLELMRLQKSLRITVLYVTHDQSEALTMSDRVGIMRHGRLEQLGPPSELYSAPANAFVANFVGETSFLSGKVVEVSGDAATVEVAGHRLPFRPKAAPDTGNSVSLMVRPENVAPTVGQARQDCIVEAKVLRAIYLGEATIYQLGLSDGQSFSMKRLNVDGVREFAEGETVWVGWSAEAFRQVHSPHEASQAGPTAG